jgi:hypothetical protein
MSAAVVLSLSLKKKYKICTLREEAIFSIIADIRVVFPAPTEHQYHYHIDAAKEYNRHCAVNLVFL